MSSEFVISVIMSTISIFLAVFIAFRQNSVMNQQTSQMDKLKEIGVQTHDTAKTLRSDAYTCDVMKKFFMLHENRQSTYDCIFPVIYDKRPLPYIAIGDYYALHIIQSRLGVGSLNLMPINKITTDQYIHTGKNVIFICAPQANPSLAAIAPPLTYPFIDRPMLLDEELPCWFADYNNKTIIHIQETEGKLFSQAEAEYERYANCTDSQFEVSNKPITDYALIIRITISNQRIVVIAGIHQYGTWIGGEFFRKLITPGALDPYESIFLSDQDFAAILWGEFDQLQYSVSRCNILQDFVWIKKDGKWGRVGQKDISTERDLILPSNIQHAGCK